VRSRNYTEESPGCKRNVKKNSLRLILQ